MRHRLRYCLVSNANINAFLTRQPARVRPWTCFCQREPYNIKALLTIPLVSVLPHKFLPAETRDGSAIQIHSNQRGHRQAYYRYEPVPAGLEGASSGQTGSLLPNDFMMGKHKFDSGTGNDHRYRLAACPRCTITNAFEGGTSWQSFMLPGVMVLLEAGGYKQAGVCFEVGSAERQ